MLERLNFFNRAKLPMIMQSENIECGLACLTMVLSFHGHDIDLSSVRRRFPISSGGATLKDVIDAASMYRLRSRPIQISLEDLDKIDAPAILHWDLNHFVVLKRAEGDKVWIHDPAKGAQTFTLEETSKHFTGIALELEPDSDFEQKSDQRKMKLSDLWGRMKGIKRSVIQAFVLSLIMQVFVLASPFLLQISVDNVAAKQDEKLLLSLAVGFIALGIIHSIAGFVRAQVLLIFSNQLSFQLIANLFSHMLRLPVTFFERRHIGDILSRFSSTESIRQFLTEGVVAVTIDGLMAFSTLILMMIYSPLLGAAVIAFLTLHIIIQTANLNRLKARWEEVLTAKAKESSVFIEAVRGIMTVKVFGKEESRKQFWLNRHAEVINKNVHKGMLDNWLKFSQKMIFSLEQIALVYLAFSMVLANEISVGMVFAFFAYKQHFRDKAIELVERFKEFRMLRLHLDRISDIAFEEEEKFYAEQYPTGNENNELQGDISIENITFSYGEGERAVLDNVSCMIGAGESVAIVGASGGGKTTLLKIMLGLFKPQSGQVLVDGQSIFDGGLVNFRRQISAIMQDDALFTGSLAENIAFFDSSIDMQLVMDCAKAAHIYDDIMKFPMRFETQVGDMGSTLSGGQKQRILLARALYRQPKVLFMDEGTAHLDLATEKLVNKSISDLGITRVIIAHRPDTIKSVDRIFELKKGRITEIYDFDERLKKSA